MQRYREHLEELVRERTQALEQSEAERQVGAWLKGDVTTLGRLLGATVHAVPAGHNLMTEAPDEVLAALRAALAVPRASAAAVSPAAAPA